MQFERYAYLDGIRGVAALFVLIRHTESLWGLSLFRSYLAVDLFFILSGFVIAHAYDKKLSGRLISAQEFFLIRLIRLYPVFLISVLLGVSILAAKALLQPQFDFLDLANVLGVAALTALILPSSMPGNAFLFPINIPAWSLFFELVANYIYAVISPGLRTAFLVSVVGAFGLIVLVTARVHGDLDVGATWGGSSIASGFARAMFGIFFGLLLYRHLAVFARPLENRALPWVSIVAIILVLSSPSIGRFDPMVDMFAVAVVFPVCVLLAAQATRARGTGVLLALGSASYPMYVLHVPVSQLVIHATQGTGGAYAPFSGILFAVFMIALSIWMERRYDIPVRRWLHKRLQDRLRQTR